MTSPGPLSESLELAASAISAAKPGWGVFAHATIDSTSLEARRLLAASRERSPFIVLADHQSAGRGRTGTQWEAPPAVAFLGTVAFSAGRDFAKTLWPLRIAIACAEALELAGGLPLDLKWPNDLLSGGRKVGGILLEDHGDGWILAGVGVNLLQSPNQLPPVPEGFPTPTSVAIELSGMAPSRDELIVALCERLIAAFETPLPDALVTPSFKKRWYGEGARVRSRPGEREVSGTAVDIDADGYMILRDDAGTLHRISNPVEVVASPRETGERVRLLRADEGGGT